MVSNKETLPCSRRITLHLLQLASACLAISLSPDQVYLLTSIHKVRLSLPGVQDTCLQSPAIGECEGPWLGRFQLIDGIQIDGGFLLRLTSREESYSWHCGRNCAFQGAHGGFSNLAWCVFGWAVVARQYHVGFQEGSLQEHTVVTESLVGSGQNLLSNSGARLQIVASISEHLRLNNRHETVVLADGRVFGQDMGVLVNGLFRRRVGRDLQYAAEFGEIAAVFLVPSAAIAHAIQSSGSRLIVAAVERSKAFVHFDARHNACTSDQVYERRAVVSLLIQRLFEENDTTNATSHVLAHFEEQLAVLATVLLRVLDADVLQPLAHRASALVSGQDAFPFRNDAMGNRDQFLLLFLT